SRRKFGALSISGGKLWGGDSGVAFRLRSGEATGRRLARKYFFRGNHTRSRGHGVRFLAVGARTRKYTAKLHVTRYRTAGSRRTLFFLPLFAALCDWPRFCARILISWASCLYSTTDGGTCSALWFRRL